MGPLERHIRSRRKEGGLPKVERTILLKNDCKACQGPLVSNAIVWGREKAGSLAMYLLEIELENVIVLLLQ